MKSLRERLTIVVLTHNRLEELTRTLFEMTNADGYEDQPQIIVVDNASPDGTARHIARDFPDVTLLRLEVNMGAAARNLGVRAAKTPYVAFCDDDTWWKVASLARAADMLDAYPRVAVLNARVLVGPQEKKDPACALMEKSPLPSIGLPGKALLGFLAGACVMRKQAFMEAGGYEPRFFIGGEEALLALDLIANGWALVYAPELIVHHYPSNGRNASLRERLLIRNALWVAWMRLPFFTALRKTLGICRRPHAMKHIPSALIDALSGIPWVMKKRKVLPPRALAMYRILERT
jgi:GT2 family glycosyltransferase